jgi:acetyl-CoA carboxylase biotin carboxyl carrier protein
MTQQNLTYDEIVSLIQAFEASSEFNRFHLRYLDLELVLEKKGALPLAAPSPWSGGARDNTSHVQREEKREEQRKEQRKEVQEPSHASSAPSASKAPSMVSAHEGLLQVTSPMVGTFYAAPEPGAAPFVALGQRVQEDTQVCIIEVMKLMSSIEAGVKGTIADVAVKNNEPVEFGQVLFWIRPD